MKARNKALIAVAAAVATLVACSQQAPARQFATGGDPDDDPCARVVSAIGYAGLLLVPEGQEDTQNFEDAVIGRLAELQGIVLTYGPAMPAGLAEPVATVTRTTKALSDGHLPRDQQVELLKEYRPAADSVVSGCAS
ncbi:hypothetical protein Aph01nite_46600 [Acrocarpospora phusangensis]|uniref:Lipoprotein n=1 Tax=Acrocarpospora phusangensis TaxID=1070424 RepID=A0A919QH28_9ACTN|nr:hypothetical protein [Acrocarpospora phusangensis]GIH26350.1 hypothetical protein Aph01nite_46600 [Acrocarpospora phusangensis]